MKKIIIIFHKMKNYKMMIIIKKTINENNGNKMRIIITKKLKIIMRKIIMKRIMKIM
jgi:hypothetical protein